ncbi:helix-turn-helix domain-containing protein [Desemzia sp. C1]|uniref:helix-turn-helix transcriptional regulator n=1 Tax=Desemzia sp. C1 TaxID=2892016 RepID=UPI001E49DE02|nr:helix-turn-helix domain-containing protein [Desemzia sp. C1]MCI3029774.1 helix-turn-helix domain-containing protein [Desemzia sp. C1]
MVANKVKGYRTMLGLSQSDLGKLLGITKQAISNKERGVSSFTDLEKSKIKEMLKVIKSDITIDEIFF